MPTTPNEPISSHQPPRLGAQLRGDHTTFRVWSTAAREVGVSLDGRVHDLRPLADGLWELRLTAPAGSRYRFLLDGTPTPDPYARFLPDGVHADAEVIDPGSYRWGDGSWRGLALADCVFYELHVGTFTPQGTYRAAMERLPDLAALGVTALELMPLAAFPGTRGWGYDGVALYAPHANYGRPDDLKAFIDAAHGLGLAVFLDAVYNHLGPDGNYLASYSPGYFTDRFHTPWGKGLDYREGHMRRLIVDNARMWLSEYHFDGLRLDATHEMQDDSPTHILAELAAEVHALGGHHLLLAEDHRNFPELVTGDGLDGIWVDDFHHSVRVTLTGEREGYYAAFQGGAAELAGLLERGWLYQGQPWPPSGEPRGRPAGEMEAPSFVYCIQNHDQIGNRAVGDRLSPSPGVTPAAYRGASALLLSLPMTPLLFQGQEWAASTPFLFFTDHHGELGRLVSEGRRREFSSFAGFGGEVPDPQDEATFRLSALNWDERGEGEHASTLELYRRLLELRRGDPVLDDNRRGTLSSGSQGDLLWVRRRSEHGERVLLWNLGEAVRPAELELPWPLPSRLLLHSEGRTDCAVLDPFEAALLGSP